MMQAALASAEEPPMVEEGLAESKQSLKKARKGKRNACFPYGNYDRYYGYRLGDSFDEDPRLRALEPAWFAGRKVLDIGCNEGILTLALACKFCCKSTLGVDIDRQLVCKASRSLAKLRSQLTNNLTQRCAAPPGRQQMKDLRGSIKALKHTRFEHLDFVNGAGRVARVETVLCLSVTKWVHFNWGDDGVRTLFARVHRALHPGGLFVLEPQPWRSYKQVFKKQETLSVLPYKNLDSFMLRPENFADYLCKKHGFKLLQQLQIGTAAKGFDRPLLIFQKQ